MDSGRYFCDVWLDAVLKRIPAECADSRNEIVDGASAARNPIALAAKRTETETDLRKRQLSSRKLFRRSSVCFVSRLVPVKVGRRLKVAGCLGIVPLRHRNVSQFV